jgi:peroxiredoxin
MQQAAGRPRRTRAAAAARPAPAPAPAPERETKQTRQSRAPERARAGRRGIDARWLIAGATAVVVAAVAAVTLLSGGMLGGGGGGAATPVGKVTETAAGEKAPAPLQVGTAAPDLTWTLDGKAGSLAGERGHPTLLVFFATWCPHCQAEVAVLNRIQDRFAAQGLEVLGVSASPVGIDGRAPASLGDTELFVQRHGARYPHLYDAAVVGGQRYGVRGFPALYLVDGEGVVRFAASGEVSEADLARAVQAVLPPAA